jgi:predicted dehydrogenase
VLVLAPIAHHHTIALDCLSAGKHVLVEKPLAITIRAARKLVAAARQSGLVLGVAENQHYNARIRVAGWLLGQGIIGEPHLWFSGFFGNEWSPNLVVAHTPWRHRKLEAGGGGALDVGVHHFHQMRVLVGEVEEVSAYTKVLEPERVERDERGRIVGRMANEVEDVYVANFRFANGAIGAAFWGWGGRGEPTTHAAHPIVYGTRGVLKGDYVALDDGGRAPATQLFEDRSPAEVKDRFFPGQVRDAFGLETRDFIRAVRSGGRMESDGESGIRDLAIAHAVLESAHAGRPVRPDDVLDGKVAEYQREIDEHYGL